MHKIPINKMSSSYQFCGGVAIQSGDNVYQINAFTVGYRMKESEL